MEISLDKKAQVLRCYCEQLTSSIDNNLPIEENVFLIKDTLTMLYKGELRKILKADSDLHTFLKSFGTFKELINI